MEDGKRERGGTGGNVNAKTCNLRPETGRAGAMQDEQWKTENGEGAGRLSGSFTGREDGAGDDAGQFVRFLENVGQAWSGKKLGAHDDA